MRQSILKSGDLVRYHRQDDHITRCGLKLGQIYEVKAIDERLVIESGLGHINLVDSQGLTDYADHFTLHRCPVVLPRGSK